MAFVADGRRRHGLERPFDPHQVGAWVVFGIVLILFYVLYPPLHHDALGISLTALYTVLALCVFGACYTCTRTDPSDPGVLRARAGDMSSTPTDQWPNYCYLCEAHVGARSKHCRRCNKCVDVFDHHCPWLNTCIGRANYRWFLLTLVLVLLLNSLHVGCALHAGLSLRSADGRDALERVFGSMPVAAYSALLGVSGLLALLALVLVAQLLFFHLGLISQGFTTYEFILAQRTADSMREGQTQTCAAKCSRDMQRNAPCFVMCVQMCQKDAPETRQRAREEVVVQGGKKKKKKRGVPGRAVSSRNTVDGAANDLPENGRQIELPQALDSVLRDQAQREAFQAMASGSYPAIETHV